MSDYNVFGKLEELCNNNFTDVVNSTDYELQPEDSFDLSLSQDVPKKKGRLKKSSKVLKQAASRCSFRLPSEKVPDKATSPNTSEPEVPTPMSSPVNLNTSKRGSKRIRGRPKAAATTAPIQQVEVSPQPSPSLHSSRRRTHSSARNRGSARADARDVLSMLLSVQTQNLQLNNNRNTRRARRAVVAEHTARLIATEYIDLVSSPMHPVQGFVNLDSDEETNTTDASKSNKEVTMPQENFDEENPEINVKVMWGEKLETFTLRKYQKFSHLFKNLAELYKCPIEHVVCDFNDQFIKNDDTPASLDYKSYNFIYARATSILLDDKGTENTKTKKCRDANRINLKIQSDKFKRPLQVDMLKTETFKILYIKCAEELNTVTSRIKLSFDGDELDQNETPEVLELDGGEAIDLRILP